MTPHCKSAGRGGQQALSRSRRAPLDANVQDSCRVQSTCEAARPPKQFPRGPDLQVRDSSRPPALAGSAHCCLRAASDGTFKAEGAGVSYTVARVPILKAQLTYGIPEQ